MAHTIKCGHCRETHPSVEAVQLCNAEYLADEASWEADWVAEQRTERWYESRGAESSRELENNLWGFV